MVHTTCRYKVLGNYGKKYECRAQQECGNCGMNDVVAALMLEDFDTGFHFLYFLIWDY